MTLSPIIFPRFNEETTAQRPIDAAGNLADLDVAAGLVMPVVADGVLGKARSFSAATGHGLAAADVVPGSTLANRDCTVRAVLQWDIIGQTVHANPGTLIVRGKGNAAAEYHPFGIEFRVVNSFLGIGEIRWIWQDAAGVLKTQVGGHFQATSTWLMFTATRRWVSSTEVVLRYYLADELLAEVTSADGSIGGGTTGVTSIGSRFTGGAYARFFAGAIDELQVYNRALTTEEVEATWKRIAIHQPRARQMVLDLHPPGFPISDNPASRVRRETALWGDAIGFATAQAENVRDNILPDRAYGECLDRWEGITKQAPKSGDSIEARRARVVAWISQKAGVSIPGIKASQKPVIGTSPDNLEILAYDQTITDTFDTAINTAIWTPEPAAAWTIAASQLKVAAAAGTFGLTAHDRTWHRNLMSIGGEGKGAVMICKMVPTALPTNGEVGIVFFDDVAGNYVLFGMRLVAGTYRLFSTTIAGYVATEVEITNLGAGLPANLWLYLRHIDPTPGQMPVPEVNTPESYQASWSTVSEAVIAANAFTIGQTNPRRKHWAGMYFRTVAATLSAVDVKFDDAKVRAPCGQRSFHLYVYRDPALAGAPDLIAANNVIRSLRQAHTHAAVITKKKVICDDITTPCDGGPLDVT